VGDLFPHIHKDFKEKSLIPQNSALRLFILFLALKENIKLLDDIFLKII
jgi:hypothetical protein